MKIKVTDILNFIATNLGFTPTGNISTTNVQSAIAEVDTEKVAKAGDTMTGSLTVNNTSTSAFKVGSIVTGKP